MPRAVMVDLEPTVVGECGLGSSPENDNEAAEALAHDCRISNWKDSTRVPPSHPS